MFGIGWVELAMIMTLVVFVMTIFLTIFSVVTKQRSERPPSAARPTPIPRLPLGSGVFLHFLIVFIIFVVLMFTPPLAWAILGQGGMPLVKVATILSML